MVSVVRIINLSSLLSQAPSCHSGNGILALARQRQFVDYVSPRQEQPHKKLASSHTHLNAAIRQPKRAKGEKARPLNTGGCTVANSRPCAVYDQHAHGLAASHAKRRTNTAAAPILIARRRPDGRCRCCRAA